MAQTSGSFFRGGPAALTVVLALAVGTPARALAGTQGPAGALERGSGPRLTLKQAGREFLSDAGRIWSSPARIRNKDIIPLVSLAAAAGLLIAADEPIRDGVQSFAGRNPWVGDVAPVITRLGGLAGFGAAGVFLGAGLVFKDGRARDTGYLAASAILQCFLVDNVIKGLSGRRRPDVADGEDRWTGPAGFFKRFDPDVRDGYVSFPSGHAATAFALATVISLQYRHHAWVPVVACAVATGVALSRMALDRHWASDTAVGALIGHAIARLVLRGHDRRRRVVPALACTGRGISLSLFIALGPAGH
jgi:membrane-associated phospholipid phosphatase